MLYKRQYQPDESLESGLTRRRRKALRTSLGPRRIRKSGFGYQKVYGDKVETLNTGYVKVWDCRGPEAVVIDRALTIRKALDIIKGLEKRNQANGASVFDH